MGRTEFLTLRIRSEPKVGLANLNESEMALFSECMQQCARKVLDTADIVRGGDLSPTMRRVEATGTTRMAQFNSWWTQGPSAATAA